MYIMLYRSTVRVDYSLLKEVEVKFVWVYALGVFFPSYNSRFFIFIFFLLFCYFQIIMHRNVETWWMFEKIDIFCSSRLLIFEATGTIMVIQNMPTFNGVINLSGTTRCNNLYNEQFVIKTTFCPRILHHIICAKWSWHCNGYLYRQ